MQIYNYTHEGEYLGQSEAAIDPLETERQGRDVYLLPANASFDPPPAAGKGQVAVFNKATGKWRTAPDYRGKIYYDTETGAECAITVAGGEPVSTWTTKAPPPNSVWNAAAGDWVGDLEKRRAAKMREVKEAFRAAALEPITVTVGRVTYTLDGEEDSARRMREGYDLAVANSETEMTIIDFHNVPHPGVSLEDARAIALAQALAYREKWTASCAKRYAAATAATIEEIEVITYR